MADIIVDGQTKVYYVPTISNIAAPTTAELNAGTEHVSVVLVRRGRGNRGRSNRKGSALRVAGACDVAFQAEPVVHEECAAGIPAIRPQPAADTFIQAGVGVTTCQLRLGHQLRPSAGSAYRQRDYQNAFELKHFVLFS